MSIIFILKFLKFFFTYITCPGTHNCIIAFNRGPFALRRTLSIQGTAAQIQYCCFYGNDSLDIHRIQSGEPLLGVINWINANGDSCDGYNNIFVDPEFLDFETNFNLTELSPCIDAGDPESVFDPDGTIADIGLYPYCQYSYNPDFPTGTEIPKEMQLSSLYPNRTNSQSTAILNLPQEALVETSVCDIRGRVVQRLPSSHYQKGTSRIYFDLKNLPSGQYLVSVCDHYGNMKFSSITLIK